MNAAADALEFTVSAIYSFRDSFEDLYSTSTQRCRRGVMETFA